MSRRRLRSRKNSLFEDVIGVEDVVLEYIIDNGWRDYKKFGRVLTESIIKRRPRDLSEFGSMINRMSHPFFAFNSIAKADFVNRFPIEDLLRESSIPRTQPLTKRSTPRRKTIPKRLRFLVLERDDFRCQLCGRTAKETKLEVDHKTALAKGGTDSLNNLWTLCIDCNRGKSDLSVYL